jgi:nitroreductase
MKPFPHSSLEETIHQRRTVKPRDFSGETIPQAEIQALLEAANWAPTHGYTEPWRFVVFTDGALARLGTFLAQQDQPDPAADNFNAVRYQKLASRPTQASHVIGIGAHLGENPKIPEQEELSAVAMAVQNIWLTAHARGLAGYWSSGALAYTEATRRFLGLAEGDRSLGFFYLGYPAKEPPRGRRLSGIEDKVTWHYE